MFKTYISYNLLVPIKVNDTEVHTVTMKAPTNENRGIAVKLKQTVMNAIMKVAKENSNEQKKNNKKEESGEGITADAITMMLFTSDANLVECFQSFETLMTANNMCKMDNTPMSTVVYNTLHYQDEENMLGEYISNFLLPSQMK